MSLRLKSSLLSKKTFLLVAALALLNNTVFAQLASSVTQSSSLSNQDNFTGARYISFLVLTAFICASIFWWRREKSKDETLERRSAIIKGKVRESNERKTRTQNPKVVTDKHDTEVNADIQSWIQNNIAGNKQASIVRQQASVKQNSLASVAPIKSPIVFQLPDSPNPIVPLPISNNELLLEAIEKIQHFDATEEEREAAINVLVEFKSCSAVDGLTQVAHYDESSRLRIAALNGLGEFDHESVFEPVLLTCADPAREVRAAAARTFARLSVNRAEAYTRIVESEDSERLRLASMVCIDAGLAKHTLSRLAHYDQQQANDAFAMVRLLVAAGQFALITEAIANPHDIKASLVMVKALQVIKPLKMMPALYHLTTINGIPLEVKKVISELVAELSAS